MGKERKGFVKILETVIASIIILTSLVFFFSINAPASGWDAAFSEITAQDAIVSAAKNGAIQAYVKNNDQAALRDFLEDLFPKSVDFSVEVIGIPNPLIKIACISCEPSDIGKLKARLGEMELQYKGRAISILIDPLNMKYGDIQPGTNILMFTDFERLNGTYNENQDKINKFLEQGGSVFLISEIRESYLDTGVPAGEFLQKVFGLAWRPDPITGSAEFNDPTYPYFISFSFAKYYEYLKDYWRGQSETETFDFPFSAETNRIRGGSYRNTVVISGDGDHSFVYANQNVINGNGRTVWIADYDPYLAGQEKLNNLTKSAVLWASGEHYKMDNEIVKSPGLTSREASIFIYDNETYIFKIITWNIF